MLLDSLVIWLGRQLAGGKAPDGWPKWLAPVGGSLIVEKANRGNNKPDSFFQHDEMVFFEITRRPVQYITLGWV